MKRWTPLALLAVLVLGAGGCVNREAQKQAERTEALAKDPTVPVTLAAVRTESLAESLELTGALTTSQDATIGAKVSGRLVAVYVKDGDAVTAGQVIAIQDTSLLLPQVRQAEGQVAAAQAQLTAALNNARIAPQRSASGVATAEAALRSARAQLQRARNGARVEEIAAARANTNAAKAQLDNARKELERARNLLREGAISQQRLDAAETAYQGALAGYEAALESQRIAENATRPEDLRAAEEAVRQAEEGVRNARANQRLDVVLDNQVDQARAGLRSAQAGLDLARQQLTDAQIRSPFSGRISGNPAQPGTVLGPGSPVARLIGTEGLYFEAQVPEGRLQEVAVGASVQVRVDALEDRSFSGTVAAVSPLGTAVGRLFQVRITLASGAAELRPGMFARGFIEINRVAEASVVPVEAVVRQDGKSFVFTVVEGKAKRVQVETGLARENVIQVTGIPAGQTVVVQGASQLTEGREVTVQEPAKASRPGNERES